eukprot:comp19445_c0_seq1/m.22593 comp19445_c0_seq1/g.22593  ORF comp19445_c0_seq1/g.22593 comp19445_c0_seq1/m.22593 type:complete len:212 (-) comp19445_c0_seq1:65-700(-)
MESVSELLSPINVFLVVVIAVLVQKILTPAPDYSKTVVLDAPKEKIEPRDFTLEELVKFNGTDDPHIFMGVSGKVYDVTARKQFYGPGGPYELFAGRDASRALAKGDLSGSSLSMQWDELDDLTGDERATLRDWVESFEAKYDVVGQLVKAHQPPAEPESQPETTKLPAPPGRSGSTTPTPPEGADWTMVNKDDIGASCADLTAHPVHQKS